MVTSRMLARFDVSRGRRRARWMGTDHCRAIRSPDCSTSQVQGFRCRRNRHFRGRCSALAPVGMRSLELALPRLLPRSIPRTFKLVAAELETNDLRIMSSTVGCEPFGTFYTLFAFSTVTSQSMFIGSAWKMICSDRAITTISLQSRVTAHVLKLPTWEHA